MDAKYVFVAALICGLAAVVFTQSEPSTSDILSNLPSELQDKLNASEVDAIKNKTQELFKDKCEKNGGPGTFDKSESALTVLFECTKDSLGLHDIKKLQDEIKAAKPKGEVDEVFKDYCKKTPAVKQCFRNFSDTIKPCFTMAEQTNLKTVYNITEQLAEFICFKEGDRIALFIAEGGPECIQNKTEEIQDCVQTLYGTEVNTQDLGANAIPEIKFEDKECKQITQLQQCVVGVLEHCGTPTSANIVESLFKFVVRTTPCKQDDKPGSAASISLATGALILAVAAALY